MPDPPTPPAPPPAAYPHPSSRLDDELPTPLTERSVAALHNAPPTGGGSRKEKLFSLAAGGAVGVAAAGVAASGVGAAGAAAAGAAAAGVAAAGAAAAERVLADLNASFDGSGSGFGSQPRRLAAPAPQTVSATRTASAVSAAASATAAPNRNFKPALAPLPGEARDFCTPEPVCLDGPKVIPPAPPRGSQGHAVATAKPRSERRSKGLILQCSDQCSDQCSAEETTAEIGAPVNAVSAAASTAASTAASAAASTAASTAAAAAAAEDEMSAAAVAGSESLLPSRHRTLNRLAVKRGVLEAPVKSASLDVGGLDGSASSAGGGAHDPTLPHEAPTPYHTRAHPTHAATKQPPSAHAERRKQVGATREELDARDEPEASYVPEASDVPEEAYVPEPSYVPEEAALAEGPPTPTEEEYKGSAEARALEAQARRKSRHRALNRRALRCGVLPPGTRATPGIEEMEAGGSSATQGGAAVAQPAYDERTQRFPAMPRPPSICE